MCWVKHIHCIHWFTRAEGKVQSHSQCSFFAPAVFLQYSAVLQYSFLKLKCFCFADLGTKGGWWGRGRGRQRVQRRAGRGKGGMWEYRRITIVLDACISWSLIDSKREKKESWWWWQREQRCVDGFEEYNDAVGVLFCATSSLNPWTFLQVVALLRRKKRSKGTWRIGNLERGGGVDAERGGRNIMVRLVDATQMIEALKREI